METYTDENGTYTVYTDPNGIGITGSIDAAAASLQLGTDETETQVVEIASKNVTTTLYGPVNLLHEMNASSLSLKYALNVSGKTTLVNASVSELTSTTIGATSLSVTGSTTLVNASVSGTLYMGKGRLIGEGTGISVKPSTASSSLAGNLELMNTYGLYNVPSGQGTSVTDGGFTFRSTNADGTAGSNLLRIEKNATGVFTYPLVPSGTNLKNNFTPYDLLSGTIAVSNEENTYTYTGQNGSIITNVMVTEGLSYRFTFTVKKSNTVNNPNIWFYPGSGDNIVLSPTLGTEYKTYSYIFKALATSVTYLNLNFYTLAGQLLTSGTIYYKHFSLERIFETTVNELDVNTMRVNKLDVPGTLKVSGALNMNENTKITTTDYTPSLFNYAPTFVASLNPGITNGITGVARDYPSAGENQFTLGDTTGAISSYQSISLTPGKKYIFTLRAKGSVDGIVIRYNMDDQVELTEDVMTLTTAYNTYTQVVTNLQSLPITSLYLHITGATGNTVTWSSLTFEPYYDMTIGSNSMSLGSNMTVTSAPSGLNVNTMPVYTATNGGANPQIAFGNGVFVVSSDGGNVHVSSDGITWNSSITTFPSGNLFRGLAFGNGIFMLISLYDTSISKVWTSTDGIFWTAKTDTIRTVYWLSYGNGLFLALSDAINTVSLSVDGSSWTNKTVTSDIGGFLGSGFGRFTDGANVWISVGVSNKIIRSTDNFINSSPPTSMPTPTGYSWRNVAFGNDIFMITAWNNPGALSISKDKGLTWSAVKTFTTGLTKGIIFVNNTWILSSTGSIWFSKSNVTETDGVLTRTDGDTWQKLTVNFSPDYFSYGNNSLIGVSANTKTLVFQNQQIDGSTLRNDVVSIGREGTTTNLLGTVVVGSTGGSTTIQGGVIKQVVPVLTNSVFGSGTVSNIFGNADNTTSISTTFNRKNTVVNSPNSIDCYQLTIPSNYSSGYFELIIGGTNYFTSAYSYKGFFGILANRLDQNEVIISPVSSLFSIGYYTPVITITRPLGSSIVTISVNTYNPAIVTNPPQFQNQNFITTLIAYPTIINDSVLNDFAVRAI